MTPPIGPAFSEHPAPMRETDGVDTTIGGAADALIAAAKHHGGPIRRIAQTHGDHAGSLDTLKERLAESVRVLMPERDARLHAQASARAGGATAEPAARPGAIRAPQRTGS